MHNAGVFAGIYHVNAGSVPFSFEEKEKIRKLNLWKALASNHNVSLPAVACSFSALPNCVEKLVMGMKSVEEVNDNLSAGRLAFSNDLASAVNKSAVTFIAVGTPPKEDGSADLSHVEAVAKSLGECVVNPTVIVNKSTVPVGTGDKVRDVITNCC